MEDVNTACNQHGGEGGEKGRSHMWEDLRGRVGGDITQCWVLKNIGVT